MHTVAILAHALDLAERLGYTVRQEWLEAQLPGVNCGGGGCELRGRKYLFIDLATSPAEQLETVLGVLRGEPRAAEPALFEIMNRMPQELRDVLRPRKSA
jgi:hypothetical protein